MKKSFQLILILLLISLIGCSSKKSDISVSSPNQINKVEFGLSEKGQAYYKVIHKDETVIDSSYISFDFKNQNPLKDNLKVLKTSSASVNETWEMPWGEQRDVVNNYNELIVELEEVKTPNRQFNLIFRVFDDGLGFRYEFLAQNNVDSLFIKEENTEFQLTGDHSVWWIPGDWDIYEHTYKTTKLSEINALDYRNHPNLAQTFIPVNAVNTPVTMKTNEGLFLSFHEANLTDYAGMTLKVDTQNYCLTSGLVGSKRNDYKVKRALPFKTPWRYVQIGEKAVDLINSRIILNLNEPNKLGSVDWFKPMKYIGIWWELHLGVNSWGYGLKLNKEGVWEDKAHGHHGANNENVRKYIDFAAENGFGGVLVEGWNVGWDSAGVFDFISPYPDYDLPALNKYAKENGVEIIMHHETWASASNYEKYLDTAFALMNSLQIHAVKTGYVGKINPQGEYHHGQWMVNHYRKVVEIGAKNQVAINAHEPIKATGIRRTYPNAIAREGLRGQEFNAWSEDGGNPPEHLSIVAFTRMLSGPIDFTPGVFKIDLPQKPNNQVNTTIAHQLALYVVLYSPIQMACDLLENYEGNPAFNFIRDVGVDWEQSIAIDGEIGDFVVIAREERETGNWFVGGISDENARDISLKFDFLDDDKTYIATFYRDSDNSHYSSNPISIEIESEEITKSFSKELSMKEGGGFAISILEKK